MKIKLTSVLVDNQEKALKFYTGVLGFVKKADVPAGEYRWLSVASPDDSGLELLLEPNAHPASKAYQEALYRDGIPLTALFSEDIEKECVRLKNLGVAFKTKPTKMGDGTTFATFDDTCGNFIQLVQL